LVKEIELPTSCITLSKYEEEFCRFLKNVKVPSDYSMNVSMLISLSDLKIALDVKFHDYHVFYTYDSHCNLEYPTGQYPGGYYELLLFLQCNWSKSTK
jgi:hypothetical protein